MHKPTRVEDTIVKKLQLYIKLNVAMVQQNGYSRLWRVMIKDTTVEEKFIKKKKL